jgi:hypothetical protein
MAIFSIKKYRGERQLKKIYQMREIPSKKKKSVKKNILEKNRE